MSKNNKARYRTNDNELINRNLPTDKEGKFLHE